MNIFVTGSSGFLGRAFLDALRKKTGLNDRIILLLRKTPGFIDSYKDKRIIIINESLENIERCKKEILSSEYIFHIAGDANYGNGEHYEKINFIPAKKIADIAKASSVLKNFIFISTIGAVDRRTGDSCRKKLTSESAPSPVSDYGKSKLKAEDYIKKSGISFTIIRPTWIWGKNMRQSSHLNFFTTLANENSLVCRIGFPGKVSLINVDDLANAMASCIGNKECIGKTYFAATEDMKIGKILKIISRKIHGKERFQLPMPNLGLFLGMIHRKLPSLIPVFFMNYLWADSKDFEKDLLKNTKRKTLLQNANELLETNSSVSGYWVITGANSGIGLEISKKLIARREKVILIDKDISAILRMKATVLKADLTDEKQIEMVAKNISRHKIKCLINNAGVGFRGGIEKLNYEKIETTFAVNTLAPIRLTKHLLPNLVKDGSTIVNVASSVAYNPLPNMSIYSSSKAGLLNWSESLSYELQKTNNVITFSPAGTRTNFQKNAGVANADDKSLLDPAFVAEKILEAVKKKKKIAILAGKSRTLLLASKFLPRSFNVILWGKLFEKMR